MATPIDTRLPSPVPAVTRGRRLAFSTPPSALAVIGTLATVVWSIVVIGGASGSIARAGRFVEPLIILGPIAAGLAIIVSRPHSPPWLKRCAAWVAILAAAVAGVIYVYSSAVYPWAPAAVGITALICSRMPLTALAVPLALSGTHVSIKLFTGIPTGPVADLLIAGLWIALAWAIVTGQRAQPRWLPLGLGLLIAYIVVSAVYVAFGDDLYASFYAFRSTAWYMSIAVLVAYAVPRAAQQDRVARILLLAGFAVGAYAVYRWVAGPATAEQEAALAGGPKYVTSDGVLRVIGSLGNPTALGVWCSCAVPFGFALALGPFGVWRWVGLLTAALCGAAVFGADTRAAMVATAVGCGVVLMLFALSKGFVGRRALPLALACVAIVIGGGVFAATKLSDDGTSGLRFRGLLNPTQDFSFEERVVKWQSVLEDMPQHPLGHGIAASGTAEKRYARFSSVASYEPDSMYVQIAYNQGFGGLLLFAAALLTLIVTLGASALRGADPRSSTLAMAGCASLAALAVATAAGPYIEGLNPVMTWAIVGLGLAPLASRARPRSTGSARPVSNRPS